MSVDTYLKRKNLSSYRRAEIEGVGLLISDSLGGWARTIGITARQFLFWKSLAVEVEHQHGIT